MVHHQTDLPSAYDELFGDALLANRIIIHSECLSKSAFFWQPRKRRRQLYFAQKDIKKSIAGSPISKRKRKRPTLDEGEWETQLPEHRHLVCIADKLKVIRYYKELNSVFQQAKDTIAEPVDVNATAEEKEMQKQAKEEAKKMLFQNKETLCRQKFPEIVKRSYVWKWVKTSNQECWEDLPPQVAAKTVATPNSWRRRNGCKAKGRAQGGSVPKEIQQELDHLVLEMSQGLSEVSERKEAVTADQIATWLHSWCQIQKTVEIIHTQCLGHRIHQCPG